MIPATDAHPDHQHALLRLARALFTSVPARHRWSVASQSLAGTGGAYVLTSLITVALSRLMIGLGVTPVEAVTGATLASFAIFSIIAMAAFRARTALRAWAWLLASGIPLAIVVLLTLPGAEA